MNKGLKLQVFLTVAPAILLACAGLWLLTHVVQQVRQNKAYREAIERRDEERRKAFEELRSERWKALMRDVQGQLRRKSAVQREAVLRQVLADEQYAQGAFIWRNGEGLSCNLNIPPSLALEFPPNYQWEVDGKTGALAQRGLQPFGEERHLVAWRRLQKDEVVGILVGNQDGFSFGDPIQLPFEDLTMLYWVGGCFVALVLLVAGAGTWLLVRAARQARQEALNKTNFVSLVSHELNTPLTAIIPYAEMLRKGQIASDEDRKEAYEVIADESVRLKSLVAELLDFSRLERRTKKFTMTDFDAAELVQNVVRLMRGRFPENAPSISAEGPLPVYADADAVKAILINLLDNAAKYAPGAPVEVVAEKGGTGVRVEVRDRGPGLTPDGLRNAFTRFWRADDSTTASVGGFGLGLTIARSYAREMGGDLTCAAREGGGTIFTLELKEAGNG